MVGKPEHDEAIMNANFAQNNKLLVTCSKDSLAKIWENDNCNLLFIIKGHTDYVFNC